MYKLLNYQISLNSPIGPDEKTFNERLPILKKIFKKENDKKLFIKGNSITPESFYVIFNPESENSDNITFQKKAIGISKIYDFGTDIEIINNEIFGNDLTNLKEFLDVISIKELSNLNLNLEFIYFDGNHTGTRKLLNLFPKDTKKILKNTLATEYIKNHNNFDYNVRILAENYLKNPNYIFFSCKIFYNIEMLPLNDLINLYTYLINEISIETKNFLEKINKL